MFFRGFVFSFIKLFTNVPTALAATSLINGIAHYPYKLASASILEGILGKHMGFLSIKIE